MDSPASYISTGVPGPSLGVDSTHSDEFDYEGSISDLAGVKFSSKEEGSGAVLKHKSIEPKDKAQNVPGSYSSIQKMDSPASCISTRLPGPSSGVDSTNSDEFVYESTVSDLAGVKISSKEEGSGAVLEHKSIEPKDKAQNVSGSYSSIQIENYKMAREVGKATTTHRTKPTQKRRPWSETEIKTLLKLIERHGTSWANLKVWDVEDVLKSRDQTSLRDKARNMKMEYLKAGPHLPPRFEEIALTKTQVDKLAELGITYDQRARLPVKTEGIKEE